MNILQQSKEKKLKISMLICIVVAAIVIGLYLLSGNINKNVANNMKGQMLLTAAYTLMVYDFEEKAVSNIAENASAACFFGDDSKIVYYDYKQQYLMCTDNKGKDAEKIMYTEFDVKKILYDSDNERFIMLAQSIRGNYCILTVPVGGRLEQVIYKQKDEIYDICFSGEKDIIYFSMTTKDGCAIKSLNVSDLKVKSLAANEDVTVKSMAVCGKYIMMGNLKNKIISYELKKDRWSESDMEKENEEYSGIWFLGENKCIIAVESEDGTQICVRNGTNSVLAVNINENDKVHIEDYTE